MTLGTGMNWPLLELLKGRLVYQETGIEANIAWPSFKTREEAEQYLIDNDIRGSLI